jgi:hypothetical protein
VRILALKFIPCEWIGFACLRLHGNKVLSSSRVDVAFWEFSPAIVRLALHVDVSEAHAAGGLGLGLGHVSSGRKSRLGDKSRIIMHKASSSNMICGGCRGLQVWPEGCTRLVDQERESS